MNSKKHKKGFTLLEIIAVISLLIVISSMAIPAYTGIVDTQKKRADVATALQLCEIAKTYYIETKDNDATKLKAYITEQFGGDYPKSKYNNTEFSVTFGTGNKPSVSIADGSTTLYLVTDGNANKDLVK